MGNKAAKILKVKGVSGFVIDMLIATVGSFLFALSIHFFTSPNQIAPGGITGIATILNSLFGLPIGVVTSVINIPILILGYFNVGKRFLVKTILTLITFTFWSDVVLRNFPVFTEDKLLAAIFGGVIMGTGIGLILSRGASTGGTDITNKIIGMRLPHLKIGKITFMSDLVVVTISAIVYQSIKPALYALVCLYISSIAVDVVLYGFDVCKFIYVISDKADAISQQIIVDMHRGATILRSYGAFTKEERPTVMVAVRQNEYYRIKKIIHQIDPNAFMIVTPASEIVGAGFKPLD